MPEKSTFSKSVEALPSFILMRFDALLSLYIAANVFFLYLRPDASALHILFLLVIVAIALQLISTYKKDCPVSVCSGLVLIKNSLYLSLSLTFMRNANLDSLIFVIGLITFHTLALSALTRFFYIINGVVYITLILIFAFLYRFSTELLAFSMASVFVSTVFQFRYRNRSVFKNINSEFNHSEIKPEIQALKFLEEIDLLVFEIDTQANVRFWNAKCERLTGYSAQEISDRPDKLKLLFTEEHDYIRVKKIITAEKPVMRKFESRIVSRFGKKLIISWVMYEQSQPGQNRFIGRDITETYTNWKNLEKSHQQLSDIQGFTKMGLWEWNPKDGKLNFSDEIYRMFECPLPADNTAKFEVLKRTISREDVVRIMKTLRKCLKNQSDITIEYDVNLPSGEKRTMYLQGVLMLSTGGEIIKYRGTNQDITELKRAEQKSRNIIHASPDAIIVTDLKLNITDFNRSALNYFEIQKAESDKNLSDFFADEGERMRFLDRVQNLSRNAMIQSEQFRMQTSNNEEFPTEISAGIIGKYEVPDLFVFFIKNITKRKAYERELESAKIKAEQSDRLKSAFLANISHEIRTPMNAIVGFANLLSDQDLTQEKRQEYAGYISLNSTSLMTLISDILDISKIDSGEIEMRIQAVEIDKLIQNVFVTALENQKLLEKHELTIISKISDELAAQSYLTDRVRLKQVMDNLMHNALKFTNSGVITLSCYLSEKGITFSVKDTGKGIEPADTERIFQRFVKIDTNENFKRGTGLGLAISAELVALMGGKLEVKSEIGQGSEFLFTLPAERAVIQKVKPQLITYEPENWDCYTILIAEDDDINFFYLKTALTKSNIQIIRASNGQEAIDEIRKNTYIALILMDIGMPVKNGYEATAEIKAFAPHIPVIAQSAYAMADEHKRMTEAGCNAFLTKPINRAKLLKEIARFLPNNELI